MGRGEKMKYLALCICIIGMLFGTYLFVTPVEAATSSSQVTSEPISLTSSPVCNTTKSLKWDKDDLTGQGLFVLDTTYCPEANTGHGTDGYTWVTPGSVEEIYLKEHVSCGNITYRSCTPDGIVIGCSAIVTKTDYYDLAGQEIVASASSYAPIEEIFYLNGETCEQ